MNTAAPACFNILAPPIFTLIGVLPTIIYRVDFLFAVLGGVTMWRLYGKIPAFAFIVTCLSGLSLFAAPHSPFTKADPYDAQTLALYAASSLATILIALHAIQAIPRCILLNIVRVMAIVNGILIVRTAEKNGIVLNPSMAGCFQAVVLPLFLELGVIPSLLIVYTIFFAGQSLPLAVMFGMLFVWGLRRLNPSFSRKFFKRLALLLVITGASATAVGYAVAGHELLDPNGRDELYRAVWNLWSHNINHTYGMGLGSFLFVGPRLIMGFISLHSDVFNLLFEQGRLGFSAVMATYFMALWRARAQESLFLALVAYGLYAIANFPLHNPISACLGLVLMHCALLKREAEWT